MIAVRGPQSAAREVARVADLTKKPGEFIVDTVFGSILE